MLTKIIICVTVLQGQQDLIKNKMTFVEVILILIL